MAPEKSTSAAPQGHHYVHHGSAPELRVDQDWTGPAHASVSPHEKQNHAQRLRDRALAAAPASKTGVDGLQYVDSQGQLRTWAPAGHYWRDNDLLILDSWVYAADDRVSIANVILHNAAVKKAKAARAAGQGGQAARAAAGQRAADSADSAPRDKLKLPSNLASYLAERLVTLARRMVDPQWKTALCLSAQLRSELPPKGAGQADWNSVALPKVSAALRADISWVGPRVDELLAIKGESAESAKTDEIARRYLTCEIIRLVAAGHCDAMAAMLAQEAGALNPNDMCTGLALWSDNKLRHEAEQLKTDPAYLPELPGSLPEMLSKYGKMATKLATMSAATSADAAKPAAKGGEAPKKTSMMGHLLFGLDYADRIPVEILDIDQDELAMLLSDDTVEGKRLLAKQFTTWVLKLLAVASCAKLGMKATANLQLSNPEDAETLAKAVFEYNSASRDCDKVIMNEIVTRTVDTMDLNRKDGGMSIGMFTTASLTGSHGLWPTATKAWNQLRTCPEFCLTHFGEQTAGGRSPYQGQDGTIAAVGDIEKLSQMLTLTKLQRTHAGRKLSSRPGSRTTGARSSQRPQQQPRAPTARPANTTAPARHGGTATASSSPPAAATEEDLAEWRPILTEASVTKGAAWGMSATWEIDGDTVTRFFARMDLDVRYRETQGKRKGILYVRASDMEAVLQHGDILPAKGPILQTVPTITSAPNRHRQNNRQQMGLKLLTKATKASNAFDWIFDCLNTARGNSGSMVTVLDLLDVVETTCGHVYGARAYIADTEDCVWQPTNVSIERDSEGIPTGTVRIQITVKGNDLLPPTLQEFFTKGYQKGLKPNGTAKIEHRKGRKIEVVGTYEQRPTKDGLHRGWLPFPFEGEQGVKALSCSLELPQRPAKADTVRVWENSTTQTQTWIHNLRTKPRRNNVRRQTDAASKAASGDRSLSMTRLLEEFGFTCSQMTAAEADSSIRLIQRALSGARNAAPAPMTAPAAAAAAAAAAATAAPAPVTAPVVAAAAVAAPATVAAPVAAAPAAAPASAPVAGANLRSQYGSSADSPSGGPTAHELAAPTAAQAPTPSVTPAVGAEAVGAAASSATSAVAGTPAPPNPIAAANLLKAKQKAQTRLLQQQAEDDAKEQAKAAEQAEAAKQLALKQQTARDARVKLQAEKAEAKAAIEKAARIRSVVRNSLGKAFGMQRTGPAGQTKKRRNAICVALTAMLDEYGLMHKPVPIGAGLAFQGRDTAAAWAKDIADEDRNTLKMTKQALLDETSLVIAAGEASAKYLQRAQDRHMTSKLRAAKTGGEALQKSLLGNPHEGSSWAVGDLAWMQTKSLHWQAVRILAVGSTSNSGILSNVDDANNDDEALAIAGPCQAPGSVSGAHTELLVLMLMDNNGAKPVKISSTCASKPNQLSTWQRQRLARQDANAATERRASSDAVAAEKKRICHAIEQALRAHLLERQAVGADTGGTTLDDHNPDAQSAIACLRSRLGGWSLPRMQKELELMSGDAFSPTVDDLTAGMQIFLDIDGNEAQRSSFNNVYTVTAVVPGAVSVRITAETDSGGSGAPHALVLELRDGQWQSTDPLVKGARGYQGLVSAIGYFNFPGSALDKTLRSIVHDNATAATSASSPSASTTTTEEAPPAVMEMAIRKILEQTPAITQPDFLKMIADDSVLLEAWAAVSISDMNADARKQLVHKWRQWAEQNPRTAACMALPTSSPFKPPIVNLSTTSEWQAVADAKDTLGMVTALATSMFRWAPGLPERTATLAATYVLSNYEATSAAATTLEKGKADPAAWLTEQATLATADTSTIANNLRRCAIVLAQKSGFYTAIAAPMIDKATMTAEPNELLEMITAAVFGSDESGTTSAFFAAAAQFESPAKGAAGATLHELSLSPALRGVFDHLTHDMGWDINASDIIREAWIATNVTTSTPSQILDAKALLFGTSMREGTMPVTGAEAICHSVRESMDQTAEPRAYQIGQATITGVRAVLKQKNLRAAPEVVAMVLVFERAVVCMTRVYMDKKVPMSLSAVRDHPATAKASNWRLKYHGQPTQSSVTGIIMPQEDDTRADDDSAVVATSTDSMLNNALAPTRVGKLLSGIVVADESIASTDVAKYGTSALTKDKTWKNLALHMLGETPSKRVRSPVISPAAGNKPDRRAVPSPLHQKRRLHSAFDSAAASPPGAPSVTPTGSSVDAPAAPTVHAAATADAPMPTAAPAAPASTAPTSEGVMAGMPAASAAAAAAAAPAAPAPSAVDEHPTHMDGNCEGTDVTFAQAAVQEEQEEEQIVGEAATAATKTKKVLGKGAIGVPKPKPKRRSTRKASTGEAPLFKDGSSGMTGAGSGMQTSAGMENDSQPSGCESFSK